MTDPKYTEPGWYVRYERYEYAENKNLLCAWYEAEDLEWFYARQHTRTDGKIYTLYPVPEMTRDLGEPK